MRKPYIAGNWKMHKTATEAAAFARELRGELDGAPHTVMLAPPFTALSAVSDVLKGSSILLGAQNMASEESGAHTGEVSVLMLKELGVSVVILGHSERRHSYGETDALINAKVKLALVHGLSAILCIGETLDEREADRVTEVVERQLETGLAGINEDALSRVVIAYEPVWAIGTGKTATPDDADSVHRVIRNKLAGLYSKSAADAMVIQYGGSVKPDNVVGLMAKPNIDGALVGGASLRTELFVPIARFDRA